MPQRRKPSRISKARRSTATKVRKIAKDLSNLKKQVERKSADYVQNYSEINSSGDISHVGGSLVTQGTGDTERIGNKITAKSLQIRWQAKIGASSVVPNDAYNQLRLMVIRYETDDPATAPTIADFLENHNVMSPEETMVSPYKRDSNYQFTIMHDKVHNLYWGNNSGGTGGAPRLKMGILKFNLKDRAIRYATGGPKTNYIVFSVSDSGATPSPELALHSRFYFTDK